MKPNKAARPDEIQPEFIKNGGLTLKQIIPINSEDMETRKSTPWIVRRYPVPNI